MYPRVFRGTHVSVYLRGHACSSVKCKCNWIKLFQLEHDDPLQSVSKFQGSVPRVLTPEPQICQTPISMFKLCDLELVNWKDEDQWMWDNAVHYHSGCQLWELYWRRFWFSKVLIIVKDIWQRHRWNEERSELSFHSCNSCWHQPTSSSTVDKCCALTGLTFSKLLRKIIRRFLILGKSLENI